MTNGIYYFFIIGIGKLKNMELTVYINILLPIFLSVNFVQCTSVIINCTMTRNL